ncbi:MAG: glycosyltransferase [Candidatus Limnocylindrales bacterium]
MPAEDSAALRGPIPRRLHQVWVGPRPVPDAWANRWRRSYRGWVYRLWREPDIEAILPADLRSAWEHFLAKPLWHGATDIARVAIVQREGGVYVDIDSEPVRSLDKAPFMRGTLFAGLEFGTPDEPIRITNGVIGSTAGHPILARYIELIANAEAIEPPWRTVGGGFLTQAILEGRELPGVAILPVRTFYPEDKDGIPAPGDEPVYMRQYWATNHKLYDFQGESWRKLAKRRRREPVDEPMGVWLARRFEGTALPRITMSARRTFRALVPQPIRRSGRSIVRRALRALGRRPRPGKGESA